MTARKVSTAKRLERALARATDANTSMQSIDLNAIESPELLVQVARSVKATADALAVIQSAHDAEQRRRTQT